MRCYICNREISENPSGPLQCKAHGEHIIHNGIRGKLISKTILCEECGGAYSKEDSAFCKIFDAFMAALNDRLIPADHGKDTVKILKGSLYDTPDGDPDGPNREVAVKDGVAAPLQPYYEIEGDKITVYAEKSRIDHYINVVARELNANGKNVADFTVEKVTDIHDKGYLAYYFSKDNATFNDDFKKGIVKIATEYALECGIDRAELTDVISVNNDGTAAIDCSKTMMIPYVPTSLFDILYENGRYYFEDGYPSHSLRLFSTDYSNGSRILYCYVDLFSTFQYYVILSRDYKGHEINKTYAQRLIPRIKEKPDVTHYRPKDLSIVIQEYKIDMSQCKGDSYQETVNYVQHWIRKYPLQTYDLQQALNWACERVQQLISFVLLKSLDSKNDEQIEQLTKNYPASLLYSTEELFKGLTEKRDLFQISALLDSFVNSADVHNYRAIGFDMVDGEIQSHSQPDECIRFCNLSTMAVKTYTNSKFSHLNCFCHEPESLEK